LQLLSLTIKIASGDDDLSSLLSLRFLVAGDVQAAVRTDVVEARGTNATNGGRAMLSLLTREGEDMVSQAASLRGGHEASSPKLVQQADELLQECDYPSDITVLWWPVGIFAARQEANVSDCEVKCVEPASDRACGDRADGVVYHLPTNPHLRPNRPEAQISIGFSKESTANYPSQQVGKLKAGGFDAVATCSPDADVQVTYSNLQTLRLLKAKSLPGWGERLPRVALVASNCRSSKYAADREGLVSQLAALGVPVDSLGRCAPQGTMALHNATFRDGKKTTFLQKYRVYLAFENSAQAGYVTEKVVDGYEAGTVPVYWGASDVDHFVPPRSMIQIKTTDRSSLKRTAAQIKAVLEEQSRWEDLMAWKSEAVSSWRAEDGQKLEALWSSSKLAGSNSCRMCKKVRELKRSGP